jgi:hypothetical protein
MVVVPKVFRVLLQLDIEFVVYSLYFRDDSMIAAGKETEK